jgi:hypothetical protein
MRIASRVFAVHWKRTIWRSFALLLVLLLPLSMALAAGEIQGTLAGADHTRGTNVTITVDGQVKPNTFAGVLLVDLTSPVQQRVGMFCIQVNVPTRAGTNYANNGSITSGEVIYLLSTYPALSITSPAQGAAVQLAIWHFTDPAIFDVSSVTDANIRAQAQALVQEAENAPPRPVRNAPLSLTITPSTASVMIGQTQTFTLSAGASGAGLTANITVGGPAQLAGGGQQASVALDGQGNGTFDVTVTGAGPVTINASLPYTVDGGTIFTSPNNRQQLVLAQAVPFTASASATIQPIQSTETPTGTVPATETATVTGTPATETATTTGTPATETATVTGTPATETATTTGTPATETPTRTPVFFPTETATATQGSTETATPTKEKGTNCCDDTATPTTTGETPTSVGETPTSIGETPTDIGQLPRPGEGSATPEGTQTGAAGGVRRPGRLPVTGEESNPGRAIGFALAVLLVIAGAAVRRWYSREPHRSQAGRRDNSQ